MCKIHDLLSIKWHEYIYLCMNLAVQVLYCNRISCCIGIQGRSVRREGGAIFGQILCTPPIVRLGGKLTQTVFFWKQENDNILIQLLMIPWPESPISITAKDDTLFKSSPTCNSGQGPQVLYRIAKNCWTPSKKELHLKWHYKMGQVVEGVSGGEVLDSLSSEHLTELNI